MFSNDWDDCINEGRNELVFQTRNREYGAYQLRRRYERSVKGAFLIGLGILLFSVSMPFVARMFEKLTEKKVIVSDEVNLMDAPPIDKAEPPPPPVPPPPPIQQTVKFTPPVIVKDEEVPQDEPPPTQDELKETNVGVTTQEGDSGAVDLPPENDAIGEDVSEQIFTIVEEMPAFPGGLEAMYKYIQKNVKYPPVARENGITGKVFVTFIVDKEGKVKDAKVLRGIGGGCDEEALRLVNTMPAWSSGRQNGRPVIVQFNLPINFTLK